MSVLAAELAGRRSQFPKLAKKTGITEERLDQLAAGAEATLHEFRLLAKAMGRSTTAFVTSKAGDDEGRVALMFRGTMPVKRDRPHRSLGHEFHAEVFSRRVVRALALLPETQHTLDWLRAFDCRELTYLDAERNAETFRELFFHGDNVSPLVTLPRILAEQLDVVLFVLSGEPVDGASAIIRGQAFIFLSPRSFVPRMLYTLGHELGHLVARAQRQEDFASVDQEGAIGALAGPSSGLEELYCNAFSSCVLLPRAGVGVTLETIREKIGIKGPLGDVELLLLARAYGVSFEVAAKRCEDLGLLPTGGARSIYEELRRTHESPEKRAAELGLPEGLEVTFPMVSPRLLDAALQGIRNGEISVGAAAGVLDVSIGTMMHANRPTASA